MYLSIFHQRKGYLKKLYIKEVKNDELPRFEEYLAKHWLRIQEMWEPLSGIGKVEQPMSRINCIPVEELDEDMLAGEYHELPRICGLVKKAIKRGEKPTDVRPNKYRFGIGHVRFFYNKLGYIKKRWDQIVERRRRENKLVNYPDLPLDGIPKEWFGEWEPDEEAIKLNRKRIDINNMRKHYTRYFKNHKERIIFALLHTDGKVRTRLLGIDKDMYGDKVEATSWYRNNISFLGKDQSEEVNTARKKLKEIFNNIMGDITDG